MHLLAIATRNDFLISTIMPIIKNKFLIINVYFFGNKLNNPITKSLNKL